MWIFYRIEIFNIKKIAAFSLSKFRERDEIDERNAFLISRKFNLERKFILHIIWSLNVAYLYACYRSTSRARGPEDPRAESTRTTKLEGTTNNNRAPAALRRRRYSRRKSTLSIRRQPIKGGGVVTRFIKVKRRD